MFVTPSRPLLSGIIVLFLIALAPLAGGGGAAHGQSPQLDVETAGKRYVLAFPDTTRHRPPGASSKIRDELDLFIYSATDSNRVTIVQSDGTAIERTLYGGLFEVVPIGTGRVVDVSNVVQRGTITVDASSPIVLYCYMATRFGMEAWTPIPVEMWGTEYRAAAIPGGTVADVGGASQTAISSSVKAAPSEILVIAAYDNTKVTIRPSSGQMLAGRGSAPVDVTLRAGECYQVQSEVDTTVEGEQVDLGGTSIRADKPIGVISGNTRTLVRQDQSGLLMNVYKGMLMEWLPSLEQQGTEFVYLPSWDSHRPGIDARAERTGEYVRAYGGGGPLPTSYTFLKGGVADARSLARDTLNELMFPATDAVYFRSQGRMQAFMHSPSILQLVAKVSCFLNYPPCQIYAGWAPYMVEMVPREEWSGFAPYYAPTSPSGMEHNINVVTDTASARNVLTESGDPFPFTRRIPGTDLIWGSRMVIPGVAHYLVGIDGARFYGYVYGSLAGREHYSPGRTRKSDDPAIAAGDGQGEESLMAGATYEEENALSYAYPLAPRRSAIAPPDSFEVVTGHDCGALLLQVRTLNLHPSGIRSIELVGAVSSNARLELVDPMVPTDLPGRTSAYARIIPVDRSKSITARVAITDRTGGVTYVNHVYDPPRVDASASMVDFGLMPVGTTRDTAITFVNLAGYDLPVTMAKLAIGEGFSIVSTDPEGPAASPAQEIVLRPGERMSVRLRVAMGTTDHLHQDSLKVAFGCVAASVPLRASAAAPSITVNDLDFGTFIAGVARKTMEARICNAGPGVLLLDNPWSDSVVTWGAAEFSIPLQEIAMLKGKSLSPGECVTLHVTFNPLTPGVHRATARFFANTRQTKDTSVWRARVDGSSGVEDDAGSGYALVGATPNPAAGRTSIAYRLGRPGRVTLEIRDGLGRSVATLVDGMMGAGEHRAEWDASCVAAGVYYCRIIAGAWSGSVPVVVTR